jgi:hypothetical protein
MATVGEPVLLEDLAAVLAVDWARTAGVVITSALPARAKE